MDCGWLRLHAMSPRMSMVTLRGKRCLNPDRDPRLPTTSSWRW
jgi:hypothetical protein